MAELFNRDVTLIVGTRRIATKAVEPKDPTQPKEVSRPILRAAFTVERTPTREPNTCKLQIYNLAADTVQAMAGGLFRAVLQIEAGYTGQTSLIFRGTIEKAEIQRNGVDSVLSIDAADGARELQEARINESFAPGVRVEQVLKKLVGKSGLGPGNAIEKISQGDFRGAITEFKRGFSSVGKLENELNKVVTSAGFQWSVQDGQIELLKPSETTTDPAVFLTPGTGLVGSPQSAEDGAVIVRSLLNGQIRPGRQIRLKSREFDGFFKAGKVTHTGDTWGGSWDTEAEVKPI